MKNLIKYVIDRKGHDLRYAIDANKLYNRLAWTSKIAFGEGLTQTIVWYSHH